MSTTNKKSLLAMLRCHGCRRQSLSAVITPKPIRCHRFPSFSNTTSSDADSDITTLAGVAVEKDSKDPYMDFRRSMLQMILEREMYDKEELRELLHCFLRLNSPYYHAMIVRAFMEILNPSVWSSTS